MVTIFKIFLILLSTLLVQNKAFSYGMNSGKVSVSVSVSKIDKSGYKSTEATASKSIDSNATPSKNKSISDTAETHSAKNLSNENSYSYDNNDNSSDGSYGKNTAIGIGMWLGLIMAYNVWFVIWPNQKRALGMIDCSPEIKAASARTAMLFSRTNTLLSLPMLLTMVAAQNLPFS